MPATQLSASSLSLDQGPRYQRHQPEKSLLYQIIEQHYSAFLAQLDSEGKTLPDYDQREFTDYFKCGRLEHGFLRVRCESCRKHLVLRVQLGEYPTLIVPDPSTT